MNITLRSFWEILRNSMDEELFLKTIPQETDLIPENLLRLADILKLEFSKQIIPNWQMIERGEVDLPLTSILKNAFNKTELKVYALYILADESFLNKQILWIENANDLTDDLLNDFCSLDATDYIAYSKELNRICIIHHEGVVLSGSLVEDTKVV